MTKNLDCKETDTPQSLLENKQVFIVRKKAVYRTILPNLFHSISNHNTNNRFLK